MDGSGGARIKFSKHCGVRHAHAQQQLQIGQANCSSTRALCNNCMDVVNFDETLPSSFQLTRGEGFKIKCAGDAILFFRFLKMSSQSEVRQPHRPSDVFL